MTIIYSTKAKEDLTRLDWRIRDKIITRLGKEAPKKKSIIRLSDSEFYKLDLEDHIIIGQISENQFNILTVVRKQKIKIPQ